MDYVATLRVDQNRFLTRITDLLIAEVAGRPVLVSATYQGGGLASFAITDAGLPAVSGSLWSYPDAFAHWGDPQLQLLGMGGRDWLTLTGMGNGPGIRLPLLPGGELGSAAPLYGATPLPRDLTQLGRVEIGGQTFLYTARQGDVEFTLYREAADGSLIRTARSLMPLAATMPEASLDKIITVQMMGQPVLVAISGLGNFLSSQRLDAQGQIIRSDYLTAGDGAGFNVPNDVAAVTVDGQVYLIVTSARSSSITTTRLLPNGSMIPVDHVVDELGTRFRGATALATVEVDGRSYVFVGGMDDGISMFTVLPDGRLLHLETLVDSAVMTLADVSAIAAEAVAGKIVLFVASARETGITQISVDPGRIGLTGKAGSGLVEGGAGNDLLAAGRGTTELRGGDGDDVLIAWRENLTIRGGAGRDVFVATPVDGRILIRDFDPDEDRLDLSQLGMIRSVGQLSFSPFSKGIRIRFGDTLIEIHSEGGVSLAADRFTNLMFPVAHYTPPDVETVIVGSVRGELLTAARGGSEIHGLAGSDVILGSEVEDLLIGGEGDDTISAGLADDTAQGGGGDDRLRGGDGLDLISGGAGQDMLIGDGGDDLLIGDDGADSLFGGTERDRLIGGAGDDHLSGDAGDDDLQGGDGNNALSGGDGNDTLVAAEGDDWLSGGTGADLIRSGGGDDRAVGGAGDDRILAGAGDDRISGQQGQDSLLGEDGNDLIEADADHDTVSGGAGDDSLDGGSGNDSLAGDEGNDLILAGIGDDTLLGGAGDDTLLGVGGQNRIEGGTGRDLIQGDLQAETLLGGDGDDTIFGHDGADRIEGGDDQDLLFAGSGPDTLLGGQGQDLLFGGDAADSLSGDGGSDRLDGDAGDDRLSGGDGFDILHGGAGDDLVEGGDGADLLFGGAGADRFVFGSATQSSAAEPDRIGDFQQSTDCIDLTGLGLVFVGDQPAIAAGHLWLVRTGDHQLLLADLDGDGQADLAIRIDGTAPITEGDLLL